MIIMFNKLRQVDNDIIRRNGLEFHITSVVWVTQMNLAHSVRAKLLSITDNSNNSVTNGY